MSRRCRARQPAVLTADIRLADPEREGQEYLASLREHHAVPFLQPLTDIHLRSHLPEEMQPNGDINYVYLMAVIAVLS